MKRNRWIIYVAIVAALCCTGCGEKQQESTTAMEQTTEQLPAATATEAEPLPEMDEEGFFIVNDSVEVIIDLADIRVRPEEDADIYMMLEQGTLLKRTGYNDAWTRVELENTSFFVTTASVKVVETPVQTATVDDATEGDADREPQRVKKIVIDPCNQSVDNLSTEAIGPGSDETKQCASMGSTGTTFGTKESQLNLEYALLLKAELESRGYEVVLTRETDDVDISNKARAELANDSGASAMVRIQMGESSNAELNGVMAVCMTSTSPYNSDLYEDSKLLATRMLQGITAATGAVNRGIYETDQMTAINWSEIPVAEIDLGFLSNQTDEGNLISDSYKETMIKGLADGIDYFFQ